MILLLLLMVKVSRCHVISSPNSRVDNTDIDATGSSSFNTVHNVTIDCGDWDVLQKMTWQCQRDLVKLSWKGYPWSPKGSWRNPRDNPNVTDISSTERDALAILDAKCHIYERCQMCLEDSDIRDYCLATTPLGAGLHIDFQFICHQQRDKKLVYSLKCLHDSRVLAMLYFHIADRCRGMGILDDIMRRYKNAYFYKLDIKPHLEQLQLPESYLCIPRSVISTCIRDIVEDHCNAKTADLVEKYLVYYQDWFAETLQSAGLKSNICETDIISDMAPSGSLARQSMPESRMLEIPTPGTALDTVYGRTLLAYVRSLSRKDLCTTVNVLPAYEVCVLSLDDKSERSKFDILQFAHEMLPLTNHGTQCSRLEQFTACWNLLQVMCGPDKVRGLEHHATLLVEGCKIQAELDTVGCHWQKMLLPHYIQASRVTVWPLVTQCLHNPMYLESIYYSSFDGVMNDLDTVISLLQPGVEEISRVCGRYSASQLRSLLHKLHYLQRYAYKYMLLYNKATTPN